MGAIKFVMVDILKSKYQIAFLLVFSCFAFFVGFWSGDGVPFAGMLYMCFGSIILSTQPFMQDQIAESGLLNMLPLSRKERVMGRFLYGAAYVVYGIIVGSFAMLINGIGKGAVPPHWLACAFLFIGVGWLMIGLQYTLLYLIGKFKSQQFASIIMMVPGFAMFFGGISIIENVEGLPQLVNWVIGHFQIMTAIVLAVGLMVWFIGIQISARAVKNRDMN